MKERQLLSVPEMTYSYFSLPAAFQASPVPPIGQNYLEAVAGTLGKVVSSDTEQKRAQGETGAENKKTAHRVLLKHLERTGQLTMHELVENPYKRRPFPIN